MKNFGIRAKRNVAVIVTGICVATTNVYLRGGSIDSIWHLIAISVVGYFSVVIALLVALVLSTWFIGDGSPDFDTFIIIGCATLIAVCFLLLLASAGPYDFEYYD